MTFYQTNDSKFATAEWIVSANISDGATHTTIAGALTAASSGDTIFIRPGTYTENLTLKAGVNLVAYTGDGFIPNVTIIGTLSASYSGTASVSGIRLQTNGANIISMTGANATEIYVTDCYLNATNATAISSTGSNSSAVVRLTNCKGNIGTTGITYFSVTNGNLAILQNFIGNSGLTTTASSFSGLQCTIFGSDLTFPITTSGSTANTRLEATSIDLQATATALNANSTSAVGTRLFDCFINSVTSTPVSIGAGASCSLFSVTLSHSNATAVTGTGTLIHAGLVQENTVGAIATAVTVTGKGLSGMLNSTAPAAGIVGEQIRSNVTSGAAVALTNGVVANVTSIVLTRGIWDVSAVLSFTGAPTGSTGGGGGISPTSASFTGSTLGDARAGLVTPSTANSDTTVTIPSFRVSLSATTTTYYLVAVWAFTGGSTSAYGRISATRVA